MKYIADAENKGKRYLLIGWIFAIIAIFFMPFLFGGLGMLMGVIAKYKGYKGNRIILYSFIFTITGALLQKLATTFFRTYLEVMTIFY